METMPLKDNALALHDYVSDSSEPADTSRAEQVSSEGSLHAGVGWLQQTSPAYRHYYVASLARQNEMITGYEASQRPGHAIGGPFQGR